MKQLTIDTNLIRSLNPCKDRFDNYLAYYESFSGTLEQFLSLEHITYDDKVWVSVRLVSERQLVAWAAACAESVLDLFESEFPADKRPKQAIESAKSWASNPSDAAADAADAAYDARDAAANAARVAAANAAHAAAYAADAYAAYAAYAATNAANAYAAANAARDAAANAARDAAANAARDAAANAAYAAAYAARDAAAAYNRQQSLNLTLLLKATQQQPT